MNQVKTKVYHVEQTRQLKRLFIADGKEALETIEDKELNIVITDLIMPEFNLNSITDIIYRDNIKYKNYIMRKSNEVNKKVHYFFIYIKI